MILNGYTIALAILAILSISLGIWIYMLNQRISKLTRGSNAASLESTIAKIISDMRAIEGTFDTQSQQLETLEEKAARSVQGIGTIRFNPFKNAGGSHSFATAFTNERGDGVIISTLYGRERVSMFAKPIANWKSEFELTPEESEALSVSRSHHLKS